MKLNVLASSTGRLHHMQGGAIQYVQRQCGKRSGQAVGLAATPQSHPSSCGISNVGVEGSANVAMGNVLVAWPFDVVDDVTSMALFWLRIALS